MLYNKQKLLDYKIPNMTDFARITYNKQIITKLLSQSMIKMLNNFNWLRHEISFSEQRTLFFRQAKDQSPYFDHSCTRGLGNAYDYILEQTQQGTEISLHEICTVHYMICNEANIDSKDTFIRAGLIKKTNVPMEIESELENIIYRYKSDKKEAIFRAFDLHYQIILLQPFDDYNKRCARMIMNWALIENGYRPIAFTRKTDKEMYPLALLKMSQGDTKSYYKYMMKAMIASQDKIIKQLTCSKIR